MRIRSAIGLAIMIVVLKILMGDLFRAFEQTFAQFFVLSGDLMATVSSSL